jgi:hypothetical protein
MMKLPPINRWLCSLVVGAACSMATAETVKLELKKLPDQGRTRDAGEFLFRMTESQSFSGQRDDADGNKRREAEFAEVVKKQPAKYKCEYPFRGVAKLGAQKFGFVLDSVKLERGYNRLFFDLNGNGDLTDDAVIEARKNRDTFYGGNYAQCEFPRTDVTIDVDGKKLEYAFFFTVYDYGFEESKGPQYVNPSLAAGVYRDGKITLDGKEHRIVLLDFNSTGRFSDVYHVEKNAFGSDGQLYASEGDMLLLDPDTKPSEEYFGSGLTERKERVAVSKLVCIGEKYYEMKVSPVGDELTLTPYTGAVAEATNANCDRYEAVVCGDNGVLKISGERNKPIKLPVGEWRVINYRADAVPPKPTVKPADKPEPEKKADKPAEEKKARPNTGLARAVRSLMGSEESDDADETASEPRIVRMRQTMVSADATKDSPAFKVEAGKTAFMQFGPPYKPMVRVSRAPEERDVRLGLAITGSGGELVNNLMVNGGRPKAPAFQIISPSGEIVLRGKFEFG